MDYIVEQPLEIVDIESSLLNKSILEWIKNNIQPEYNDNTLKEHLYNINLDDMDEDNGCPREVKSFLETLRLKRPNACYFRFINNL